MTIFQEARETRDPFEGKKEEKQKTLRKKRSVFVVRATNYLFENCEGVKKTVRGTVFSPNGAAH